MSRKIAWLLFLTSVAGALTGCVIGPYFILYNNSGHEMIVNAPGYRDKMCRYVILPSHAQKMAYFYKPMITVEGVTREYPVPIVPYPFNKNRVNDIFVRSGFYRHYYLLQYEPDDSIYVIPREAKPPVDIKTIHEQLEGFPLKSLSVDKK